MTLFFPKKNLESFHSFRKSFNLVFLMLSTVNKNTCSYLDKEFRISSIVFCFSRSPFLFVFVSETETKCRNQYHQYFAVLNIISFCATNSTIIKAWLGKRFKRLPFLSLLDFGIFASFLYKLSGNVALFYK